MGTRWYQERRREHFHRQAKREGYRARSAYKLKQIHNRFHVIRKGDAVADLGCAPGGWTQVLVELVGPEGFVAGVDLQRTRPIEGAVLLRGDFTKTSVQDKLADALVEGGHDVLDAVVSDMAPDMTGTYDLDQARSVHLCEIALQAAERHLKNDGVFVCKIFEGADFQEFRMHVKSKFRSVRMYHPPASRKQSSEVYMVALGYKEGRPKPRKPLSPLDDSEE